MLKAICITLCFGFLYGLSLFITKKVFFIATKPNLITAILILRFLLLANFFYIMLKSMQIHPIILLVSFFIGYWLTILNLKEFIDARS